VIPEGIEKHEYMNTVRGLIERGEEITKEVRDDYEKCLRRMEVLQQKMLLGEYQSKFEKLLRRPESTILLLRCTIAGATNGEISRSSINKEECITKVLSLYANLNDFKSFVTLNNLTKHNVKEILKILEIEIRDRLVNAELNGNNHSDVNHSNN
jgi:hypothetical protein